MPRSNANGPNRSARRTLRVASVAVGLAMISAGLATGTPWRQGPRALPLDDVVAACDTDNPFVAMACVDAVMVFQDTPSDLPHYQFGRRLGEPRSDVGAVWGLAYSSREGAIYAAATHRRGVAFGPGGPGAVYRIDLASGNVTQPIDVPAAGIDHHFPDARGTDASARYWAGKTSLGDIDLDESETELFVTNLDDRRIYRFSVPDGRLIGSFPHGGAGEDWAEDARPWGLAVRAGMLYHGVVHSAETDLRRSLLQAVVYASKLDGTDMQASYATGLGYERGALELVVGLGRARWNPWQSISLAKTVKVHPMPILADIGFAADGGLLLGFKDRLGDMVATEIEVYHELGRENLIGNVDTGIALGDVLYAPAERDAWLPPDHARFHSGSLRETRWYQGGLAALDSNVAILGATQFTKLLTIFVSGETLALWHPMRPDETERQELACLVDPEAGPVTVRGARVVAAPLQLPLRDSEPRVNVPSVPGDVELLCAPTVYPTLTPSPTPLISPTPSATRTPSPTRTSTTTPTATPSPTKTPSPTRIPGPVYLPLAVSEPPCLAVTPTLDVILILDASTSMRDPTRAGRPKIDAAVAAARDFVARLALAPDGDHAALVAFNVAATLEAPLTADRAALDAAHDGIALAQFTRIDLGLDAAAAELASARRRPGATAAVILLTDGRSNPVPVSEAERAAEAVKATGARLFTIGLGQDLDADALRRMASRPQDYFEAPDGEDLAAIYQAISAALPCPPYAHWPGGTAGGASGLPSDARRLRAGSPPRANEALRPSGLKWSSGGRARAGTAR